MAMLVASRSAQLKQALSGGFAAFLLDHSVVLLVWP